MTHRRTFAEKEIQEIERLIREKLRSKPDRQKGIRAKIRKIGFYFSDFSSDKFGYTVEDLEALIRSGKINVVADEEVLQAPANRISLPSSKRQTGAPEKAHLEKDEHYVLDLCDKVLGHRSSRQHRFNFLRGDVNSNRFSARLPVDAYYADLQLVVEYRERQHTENVMFFDEPDRMTISGFHRGEQRRIYDERRRQVLPEHGISVVEISFSDFNHDSHKRIIRNQKNDEEVVKRKLRGYLV